MEQPQISQPVSPLSSLPQIQLTQPSSQPYQSTIFINNYNGFLGSNLVQTFRNDHLIQVNPNILVGTIDPRDQTQPPPDVEIVKLQEKTQYNTAIYNSDIIVFEIDNNRHEFEYIMSVLKYMQLGKKKTVVCVSNFESWSWDEEKEITIKKRNSGDDYLRDIQNLCANIENVNKQVKGYVISKGIVYGGGEKILYPHFRSSILSSSQGLNVIGKGANSIPMIHILDLCAIIQHICWNSPKQRYYIAGDGANSTQHQILKAVADNLGEGIVNNHLIEDIPMYQIPREFFLNLKTRKTDLPINWNCDGFVKNIGNVIFEFNEVRGIKTNKIFVGGMPVSGKTHIASILSKHYNLPLITTKETVEYIRNHPSQFGQNIKRILQETRIKMVEQEQKIFEENKKKKKPKKGQAVQEFDPSKVVPRLSQQNLIKVYKARLAQQDCKNKGYVLDGFPKTSHQANQLFKQAQDSLPNSGFYIQSTEEQVKDRVKKLAPEVSKDTHWTDEATIRRLGAYKTHVDGNKHILEFFKDSKIDIKKLPFNQNEPKSELISFVERNGSMGLTQTDPVSQPQQQVEQQNIAQQPLAQNRNQEQQLTLESLKQNQRKILDQKSKPIRQYLIDNVIPQLTQGLIQICRQTPNNPLDFLISFLQQKQGLS